MTQLGEDGSGLAVQFSLGVGSIFTRLADAAKGLWLYGALVESQAGYLP